MQQKQFCPCGKDVNDRKYAYHKYRCPKKEKLDQSESRVQEVKAAVCPKQTESEDASCTGNSSILKTKARPRTSKNREVPDSVSPGSATDQVKLKTKPVPRCQSAKSTYEMPSRPTRSHTPTTSQTSPVKPPSTSETISYQLPSNPSSKGRPASSKFCDTKNDVSVSPECHYTRIDPPQAGDLDERATTTKTRAQSGCRPRSTSIKKTGRIKEKSTTSLETPSCSYDEPCGDEFKTQGLSDTSVTKARSTRSSRPGTSSSDIIDTVELDAFVDKMVRENVIAYSDNPDQDIRMFFDQEVKMAQNEITGAQKHFKIIRKKIVGLLDVETELGGWEFRCGGSSADGTKVSRPDEMDCILYPCLSTKLQAVFDDTCQPGFCKLKVVGPIEDPDIEMFRDGQFLNSKQFRTYLFGKLEYIIEKDRKLKDARKYRDTLSFAIKYTGIPTESGMMSIDIDFVPSVHITQWPRGKVARDISKVMADERKAYKIKSQGFNATPKQCTAGPQESRDLQWQVSFSYAEKNLTKYAEKNCWKPVMRTVKRVVEIANGNSEFSAKSRSNKLEQITKAASYTRKNFRLDFQSRFTTYHIRTLMWTLLYELSAGEHVWKEDTKSIRLRFTLGKLQKMLTGEMVVPHFFLPEVKDIMRGVQINERKFLYIIARATAIIFSKKS